MPRMKLPPVVRKIGRVVLLIVLGYPHLLILLPFCSWLTVHAFRGWMNLERPFGWGPANLVRGIGFTVGMFVFAALMLVYLAAVVYVGWKGHGRVYRRGSWAAVHRPWLHGMISRERLLERIDALASTHAVVGPVLRDEPQTRPQKRFFYQAVSRADELALDFDCCVYSPKATLLPPRETLLRFDTRHRHFEAVPVFHADRTALVGVHPCDLHASSLLDEVFSHDQHDQHYLNRRARLFVVGIDCPGPCGPDAFCRDMQTCDASKGFDVLLYPLPADENRPPPEDWRDAKEFGVVIGTDAGRDWLRASDGAALREPTFEEECRFERYLERKAGVFRRRLQKTRGQLPDVLQRSYDSLVWKATAQRCYSCGSCNLVCPTCYCFDIQDETDLSFHCGVRERTWDGCMLHDFALVAGGHNFRGKAAQRLRHRIFRKGAWIEQRTGLTGCVGCARCMRSCTAHISIVEILNQLAEEVDNVQSACLPAGAQKPGG